MAEQRMRAAIFQIEINDGESLRPRLHLADELWREDMDATESALRELLDGLLHIGGAHFTGFKMRPAAQALRGGIYQKLSRGVTPADKQRGLRSVLTVGFYQSRKISVGEYVDIVHQHGLVAAVVCTAQQSGRMAYGTAGVEQLLAFVGDVNGQTEVVCGEIVHNLFGKVVHIHHNACGTCFAQGVDGVMQQGFAGHGHQGLGHAVGERAKACAESGSEDKGFHEGSFFLGEEVKRKHAAGKILN